MNGKLSKAMDGYMVYGRSIRMGTEPNMMENEIVWLPI